VNLWFTKAGKLPHTHLKGASSGERGSCCAAYIYAEIFDEPQQQHSALPEVSRQSITDRAVQRLDWTIQNRAGSHSC
jgi:hypothetical protein